MLVLYNMMGVVRLWIISFMYLICSWKRVFRFGWFDLHMRGCRICKLTGRLPLCCGGGGVVFGGWLGELCYCVAASETDFDVCVLE